tara:strand:- start:1147 stop:1614 length:468 start_codon:yes stop_codon:yes gene_type:complete
MDGAFVELLTQLKIIGMIRQHERFSTKGQMIRIESEGKLQPLWRWLFGEDRENNMHHLQTIIDRSIGMLDVKKQNRVATNQLVTEMTKAKVGLDNLKITYEDDSVIKAKLELMCDTIDQYTGQTTSQSEASSSSGGNNGSSSGTKGGGKGGGGGK